ncbi:MAG: hypothetical protein KDJ18_11860, partial [Hyphomicrobiaceae bacterium]|nr:hypothetical protein [Hyphomicrobiaceae bacterium]
PNDSPLASRPAATAALKLYFFIVTYSRLLTSVRLPDLAPRDAWRLLGPHRITARQQTKTDRLRKGNRHQLLKVLIGDREWRDCNYWRYGQTTQNGGSLYEFFGSSIP